MAIVQIQKKRTRTSMGTVKDGQNDLDKDEAAAAFVAPLFAIAMVVLRLFVCPWLRLPWILLFLVCTNASCAPHDIVFPMVSYADVVESVCFPLVFRLMPWS